MKVKIKIPTEYTGSATGVRLYINDVWIPSVGVIENPKELCGMEIHEGVCEVECDSVTFYGDNDYLRVRLNGGEIDD